MTVTGRHTHGRPVISASLGARLVRLSSLPVVSVVAQGRSFPREATDVRRRLVLREPMVKCSCSPGTKSVCALPKGSKGHYWVR